jgi:hypothetical protein
MKSIFTPISIFLPERFSISLLEKKESDFQTRVDFPAYFKILAMIIALAIFKLASPQNIHAQGSQIFSTTGTFTFTAPVGVTSVTVECWGGGGGGGSSTVAGTAGGGGGGAYAAGVVSVTPGNNYTVIVGQGGASNTAGGNSSFGTQIIAAGGSGGANNNDIGAAGGSVAGSSGSITYRGGNGGTSGTNYSGGGGGGAGSTASGGDASGQTAGIGTDLNGGNGGAGVTTDNNGLPGSAYGGGGSGSYRLGSVNRTGGSGANGLVKISWPCPSATISYPQLSYCTSVSAPQSVILSGTVGGTFSSAPAGLTIDPSSGSITPSTSLPNDYLVTYNIPGAGGCSEVNATATVSIYPVTEITVQMLGGQTQCINEAFDPIYVTAKGHALTYQWYSNTTASTTGGTALGSANGANTAIYTPQSDVAGTLYYYCEVSGTCGTNVKSNISGAFVVRPPTSISSQSTNAQTACINGTFAPLTVTPGGSAPFTYQWYSNTSANTSGGSSLGSDNGAQTASFTPQNTVPGTLYYYCVVQGLCGSAAVSDISEAITVNPGTQISDQSTATQTQCLNGTFSPISVAATGTGTIVYQWYSNTSPTTTGATSLGSANGAQTASYIPQATSAGTLYYYCVVHSDCGPDVTSSFSGAFITNPPSVGGNITGGSGTIIYGSPTGTMSVTGQTGTVVKWQKMYESEAWTDITNTALTYNETPTAAGKWQYRALIKSGECSETFSSPLTVTVTPKVVTVTPVSDQSKIFGDPDPVFTYTNSEWSDNANFTGALGRVAGENVGPYDYNLGTLSAGTNYTLSIASGPQFSITPKAVTITPDAGQTKIFGTADPTTFTYTHSALVGSDAITGLMARITGEDVGDYLFTIGTLTAGGNYTLSVLESPKFSITTKAIIITPDAGQTKIYGNSDPLPFTFTNTPLEGADEITGLMERDAGENVGSYTYTLGTLTAGPNYNLSVAASPTFNITPKPITVTPDAGQTKVFGTADPVSYTYTNTTLVGSDAITGQMSREAGENAGTYTFTQGTLTAGSNYTLTVASSPKFTIAPKSIVITGVAGQSKIFGTADPATFSYTFAPDLEGSDVITGEMTRVIGENVGEYAYKLGTLDAGPNYSLSIVATPAFSIQPKSIVITPDPGQTKVFGSADPLFTYTSAPALLGSDTFSGELSRDIGQNAGQYDFLLGTLTAGINYSLSIVNTNKFTITPKSITIFPDAGQSKVEGDPDPVLTYTNSEWPDNSYFVGILGRAAGETPGIYPFNLGDLSAGTNYVLVMTSSPPSFTISTATGIEDVTGNSSLVIKNYPNPFRDYTTVEYTLPFDGKVTLSLRDVRGNQVKMLINNEMKSKGDYSLFITDIPESGVYFLTIRLEGANMDTIRTIKIIKGN